MIRTIKSSGQQVMKTPGSLLLKVITVVTFAIPGILPAQDSRLLLDLRGTWKFELGDESRWSNPAFNDSKWTEIKVPGFWEDQGYPGYDGYAWYRKHIQVPQEWTQKDLQLSLGMIDDVDEVYINGEFIGFTGLFPPHYVTAYDTKRDYPVPSSILNPSGDNVIAVRVYDHELGGGIVRGNIGLFERIGLLHPEILLTGQWRFTTGDDMAWKEPGFNENGWKAVHVPAHWETQGFLDYDGFGWYRIRFTLPSDVPDRNLILLLGKIDDYDETYLNGERIGRTGPMPQKGEKARLTDDYARIRAYTIPPGTLLAGQENVLAVRVYDVYLHGGIYDGPIGIVTRDRYLHWKPARREPGSWLRDLLDAMFH